jgi:hypothetical protein
MRVQQSTASILIVAMAFAFSCPPASWAQNAGASQSSTSPAQPSTPQPGSQDNAPSSQQGQQQTTATNPQANGGGVNPSQPPLQPVTTYPDAAGNPQKEMDAGAQPRPAGQSQTQAPSTEPQGAATAEKVPTAGGAAAKPAGAAIAPAKQRQPRSLLIKLGAVAAGAVAAGTIYALSKGTPSTPPGSGTPGAVQKR